MELGAKEIKEKQFRDAWRGYNQDDVDDFLDRVAEAMDALQREIAALRERLDAGR
jgi:cell division initiation protein